MIKLTLQIFITFFRIGCFTFGGGYAMIPIIGHHIMDKRGWMNEEEFMEMVAIAQSFPGPISLNVSLYTGYRKAGWAGGAAAFLGITLPSFIIMMLIAMVFTNFQDNKTVEKIFKGIRPVVVAIIAGPMVRMAKIMKIGWKTGWIPVVAALLIWLAGWSPMWVLLLAATGGIVWQRWKEGKA